MAEKKNVKNWMLWHMQMIRSSKNSVSTSKVIWEHGPAHSLCVTLKYVLKPTPKVVALEGGAFERWPGHEGSALTLTQGTPESSLTPSTMRGQNDKTAVREAGSGSSPDTGSAASWSWTSQPPDGEEHISGVYKPRSLWCSVTAAQTD